MSGLSPNDGRRRLGLAADEDGHLIPLPRGRRRRRPLRLVLGVIGGLLMLAGYVIALVTEDPAVAVSALAGAAVGVPLFLIGCHEWIDR